MPRCLLDRLKAAGKLPTPPAVVLRLLELTRRDDVSAEEIADTLSADPALTAKVLRFANSPAAGLSRQVTSLQHAVTLLGIRGIKMMALSFTVLGSGAASVCEGFDPRGFALQSLGCGVAARRLAVASRHGHAPDAFVAGLLSQIGRSALAVGLPDDYALVLADAQQVPRDLPPLEARRLGDTFPAIGARLLRSWHIPETLCVAIETFRKLDDVQDAPPLARLLCVAEVAAGIICPDVKSGTADTHAFVEAARTHLGIEASRCAELMNEMAWEVEDVRAALDMPPGNLRHPADLESEVRDRLAELSLAMNVENRMMAQRQDELMRQATTDALTGVGNRAAFDARMTLEVDRAARNGTPISLLMIDIDGFKGVNDAHGHQAGDRVLRTVAHALDMNVRKIDFVARYGGEEFAVVAPDVAFDGAIMLAQRLRKAVEETAVAWGARELAVTISIGVAARSRVTDSDDPSALLREADGQLYSAKNAGRNRIAMSVDGEPCLTSTVLPNVMT